MSLIYYFTPVAWQWDVSLPDHRAGADFQIFSLLPVDTPEPDISPFKGDLPSVTPVPIAGPDGFLPVPHGLPFCVWPLSTCAHVCVHTHHPTSLHSHVHTHLHTHSPAHSPVRAHTYSDATHLLNIKALSLLWRWNLLSTQIIPPPPPPPPKTISIREYYWKHRLVPLLKSCFPPLPFMPDAQCGLDAGSSSARPREVGSH